MQLIADIQIVITENMMTMKKTTVNSKILTILFCLLTLLPSVAKAQVGFDAVSIEAYIKDHKQQRSLLLVRSTMEASNKLLHDYSGDANLGFRDINKELDKYTRAFDVIDILYQSLRTSLNVYSTYENVSDKVGDYRKMLNDFRKKCLERGNIMSTDTLIIIINTKALAKIADEGDNLYRSVSDLLLYATGAAACSTSDLLLIITSINNSLDNINKHLIQLDAQVSQIAVANDDMRNRIDAYITSQMEVNKKIMADIIETAYHANKATKTIEINRFRHLSEVYNVYHSSPLHGNSYITEIYEEMCKWEKL